MSEKGYWIAQIDVNDPEGYKQYVAANAIPFRKFGAKFITRGGKKQTLEGTTRARLVVIEFKDYETAVQCYHSPEYAAALALRHGKSISDLAVIEGYSGPQPTD